ETVEACRRLWGEAPASFNGKHVRFEDAYSKPFPLQGAKLPVLFGIGPSDRNLERLARYADGWAPLGLPLETISRAMTQIRRRLSELGRDPEAFRLRLSPEVPRENNVPNIDAALDRLPELAA